MAARDVAVSGLFSVFVEKRSFDEAFNTAAERRSLEPRDRAFARLVATSVLRNRGALGAVVSSFLERPLPENRGRLEPILLAAAAQLLLLDTPPHAAISLAVDQCRADSEANRFAKLANAILRRTSELGADRLAKLDRVRMTVPDWLLKRWERSYGAGAAYEIAAASLVEPTLDLTVKEDAASWATRLQGTLLSTGTIRLTDAGRVEQLDGYDDGAWWVQDAAAAIPARLFGDIRGLKVADLCAAPGGKTAQLATAGAHVTAIDKSPGRLKRLQANLKRLGLTADVAVSDAASYRPEDQFDAVLIDAPCTATGTIRRHPDILHLKRPEDVTSLASLQGRILDNAANLVRPGGTLVYCTCSLEAEECAEQVERFLAANGEFKRKPILASEFRGDDAWITAQGDLRTLPQHFQSLPTGLRGMDGFYAARLVRGA